MRTANLPSGLLPTVVVLLAVAALLAAAAFVGRRDRAPRGTLVGFSEVGYLKGQPSKQILARFGQPDRVFPAGEAESGVVWQYDHICPGPVFFRIDRRSPWRDDEVFDVRQSWPPDDGRTN